MTDVDLSEVKKLRMLQVVKKVINAVLHKYPMLRGGFVKNKSKV